MIGETAKKHPDRIRKYVAIAEGFRKRLAQGVPPF